MSKTPQDYDPGIKIVEVDGQLIFTYKWKQFRYLLDDGRTVDVVGIGNNSFERSVLLTHFKAERIEGVANLELDAQPLIVPQKAPPPEEKADVPAPPAKKAAAKKAAAKKAAGGGGVRADGADPTGTDG